MKRFTMVLAMVLIVTTPLFAERVTPETARKVAATFLNNNGAKSAQLTDLSKAAGFANLYIFNGEEGFVVMSADDCVQPILGYSLTGNFVAENMPENVHGWLQGYDDEIQFAIDSKAKPSAETSKLWKDLAEGNAKAAKATVVVNALVKTLWDQDPLYNNFCPYISGEQTVTGCAATAMAQIMKYWEHPIHGIGSHSYNWNGQTLSANFETTTYDWDNMPFSLNNSSSQTQINAVATLMYHCGVALNMQYGLATTVGSSAYPNDIPSALINYFNYKSSITIKTKSSYNDNQWLNMLKTELNEDRPIQYNGWGANNSGGHSFICDGYDNSNYFHFNWGWSGRNDGFYSLSNLVPGSGGSGGGGYNFTYNQLAIFGIQPNTPSINPPTIATAVNGTNVTITWNEISDADSYRLYRNGNLIASSLTTTNYTDTDLPYGEHAYYVKSVKSDGTMSLKSNISVAIISFEGPVVTDLTATLNGNTVNLSWAAPVSESATLQYGSANPSSYIGFNGQAPFYWAQRYPVATLASYAGMAIDKVSVYLGFSGTYTLYIYNGDETGTSDLMYQTDYTVSSTGWKDINVTSIVSLDYTSDLWVVMYAPQSISYPAAYCSYSGIGAENAAYYSSSGSGWSSIGDNTSWLMKTYISDGSYTYNLYDGTNPVASNIEGTSHTVSNIANNAVHQYTVKTNYYGGESAASNMVGFAVGTASIASLEMTANDQMTITEGSKLTVSGTLRDVNADNLILENGAQLVNGSDGVLATVKKTVTAYSQDGGWNLIASPIATGITPSSDNGLLTNSYDLYTFDQSEELEWRNYEANPKPFSTIDNKVGYLYANSGNLTTISFAGALANTASATTLAYDVDATWAGFNLIGNPYPCNAYIDKSFYVLNTDGSDFTLGSNPIPPCAAILVQAQNSDDNSVTFSKEALDKKVSIVAKLTTMDAKGERVIDQARVCFDEADQLTKFTMGQGSARLYIPQGNRNYAVACANGQNEMPLNFKAAQNGTYTLDFKVEDIEADYLHLIDNKTGADVDLLTTPNYTFEATKDDYESRFKLVFANYEDTNDDNVHFAYYADGEIRLVETCHDASLQVVDMMGRVVLAGDAMNRVSTNGMTAGVYVLRLIKGEQVKTQKIVVR